MTVSDRETHDDSKLKRERQTMSVSEREIDRDVDRQWQRKWDTIQKITVKR